MSSPSDTLACTFCGKRRKEVRYLIASPIENVCVCDECVMVMVDMVGDFEAGVKKKGKRDVKK